MLPSNMRNLVLTTIVGYAGLPGRWHHGYVNSGWFDRKFRAAVVTKNDKTMLRPREGRAKHRRGTHTTQKSALAELKRAHEKQSP